MPHIDPDRLIGDLKHLRTFGAFRTGVIRTAFSDVDMESRRWLVDKMAEAGLDASIDGVGNVIGRSRNSGRALLIGSHTDTQPRGGWLDGAMGVIYALEIARAFRESEDTRNLAVDVASWMDEEGTYLSFLGSRSLCGEIAPEVIAAAKNRDGHPLTEAISTAGLQGVAPMRLEPGRYAGYLEAHIEQGGHLEATGNRIGVVTAIVGIREFDIAFTGAQNHAGTTPMPIRRDAGVALIDLASEIHAEFPKFAGSKTVWTIGRVTFDPGAPSIIPGRAEMILQFRDPEETRLDALEKKVNALVRAADQAGPVGVSITPTEEHVAPAIMDAGLQKHIAAAAETHALGSWTFMPSGAGHDAMILAGHLPSAMLFVPSIGGISHDFAEDTDEEDIVLGCQVLATAAASILKS